jgi:NAD(P)-dependent dehydrogenase (short-subunit alcohol dehydrogenase family)
MQKTVSSTIPRAALVTGAGQRLGRAIALELAELGFDIAIHYRTSVDEAMETRDRVRQMGQRAILLQADLQKEDEVSRLVADTTAQFGNLGVLVNNASRFERDEWFDATRTSWDMHMETNLRAPFVLTQAFAHALPEAADGVVINLLDQRVWSLTPHFLSYTLSKAGLWALTQTLALALAPRIRVNAIGPGPALPSPRQTDVQFLRQCASVPLGHGTSPAEIGHAVAAIMGLPAMTGQMIALDGGQHLQWAPAGSATEPEE